jgi:CheY-like chemotaxis protein
VTAAPVRGPVLVVDDDQDIREIIEIALTSHGYLVTTAHDGRECLRRVRGGERPCLILLDLMMPDMNGWAVCDELTSDSTLPSIPIVILTGNVDTGDETLRRFPIIKKPIELASLLDLIARHARDS